MLDIGLQLANQVDNIVCQPIMDLTGLPVEQIRIFVSFLISYPIGWFMHFFVRGRLLRHLYALILGVALQSYIYGWEVLDCVWMAGGAYALMLALPRQTQAKYVMFYVLGYLSYQYLYKMWISYGTYSFDIVMYTMLLVCKMSALAFCYKDGDPEGKEKLNDDQKARVVKELPSVFELASYVFFVQGCTIGPFFEFSDYKRFIEETDEYKSVPNPIIPSLKWLL